MPTDDPDRSESADDAILREMRKRWDAAQTEWEDIRKEGQKDMLCAAGQVWLAVDPKGVKQRNESGRPCLSLDELSQYVNQLVNDVRQNKRAIKVTPMGEGANDETAELKEALIRQIEYRSNAQQAYTTMFENTVQRSYGFLRIVPKYVTDESDDQELLIEPIANPDMCTPDPDHQRADGSDMRYFWVRESRTKAEFNRQYPDAEHKDFGGFLGTDSSFNAWVSEDKCYIAEYWTLETKTRELLTYNTIEGPKQAFADTLHVKPTKANILKSRKVETSSVMKYVTNGIEILERSSWPGKYLPFVCCYGKVIYLDAGEGAKRQILSMIRLARDPAQLYNYYRTAEAEVVGMTPKTPYWAYEGQISPEQEVQIQKSLHEPVALLKAKPIVDGAGMSVLPLPQRQMYEPAIQALEVGAEAARRAIQAAIGSSPLPTQAQRRNEKSGVALKQIEETAQKGSFHFIDHYEDAITRTGTILNDLLPHYYDTARDVAIRNPDDSAEVVRINDPSVPNEETGQPRMVEAGPYDVTLSTGPSYDSEREVASEFSDTLVQMSDKIAAFAGPPAAAKMISLAIKLKNLGPLGNEMADIISPPEDKQQQIPPEVQAQMQQMGQALQQAQQELATDAAKQQATIQKAQIDAQADQAKNQIDNQVKLRIAEIEAETKITIEQMKLGQEGVEARLKHLEEIMGHKADFLLQAREHEQQRGMAQVQHQQAVDEGERGHQHALEEGEQGAQAAERQIEKQAEVAPQPEASA